MHFTLQKVIQNYLHYYCLCHFREGSIRAEFYLYMSLGVTPTDAELKAALKDYLTQHCPENGPPCPIEDLRVIIASSQAGSKSFQWRHNERDGVSNHQPHDCLLNCLFRRRSKKTSKLHITGLCEGTSPVTDEFPAQRASNTENVSIWWHHHIYVKIIAIGWLFSNMVSDWLAQSENHYNQTVISTESAWCCL